MARNGEWGRWQAGLAALAVPLGGALFDLGLRWRDIRQFSGDGLRLYLLSILASLLLYRGMEGLLHLVQRRGWRRTGLVLTGLAALGWAGNLLVTYGHYLANRTMPSLFTCFYIRSEPRQALVMAWDALGWREAVAFLALAGLIASCLHLATRLPRRPWSLPWPGKALHAALASGLILHGASAVAAHDQCLLPELNTLALSSRYLWQESKGLNTHTFRLWPRTPEAVPGPLPPAPLNVLLILGESLRPQSMGLYGYHRATTPGLDAFSARHPERCLAFRRAYTNATSTLISVPSLLTGRSPLATGRERASAPLLWQWGQAAGLSTFYITSHGLAWGGMGDFLSAPPPDFLWDKAASGQPAVRDLGIDDHLTVARAVAQLDSLQRQGRPFLGVVHLNTNHYPYNVDRRYRRWDGSPQDLYDGTVLEMDAHIGRLLEALEAQGSLDRTLVIVASDHGEAFKEHGTVGHFYSQFTETISVPLWVVLPPALASRAVAARANLPQPVQNLDLLPTILDALGCLDAPTSARQAGALEGRSLLRPLPPDRDILVSNAEEMLQGWGLSLVKGRLHYTLQSAAKPPAEACFDLEADPEERHDLWPGLPPAKRRELRSRFLALPHGRTVVKALFPDTPEPASP